MYGTVIGRGAHSLILANGDRAQKIYPAGTTMAQVMTEAEAQQTARKHGVPVPHVYDVKCIENRPMMVMERVVGLPLDEAMRTHPDMAPALLAEFCRLQQFIHQVPFGGHRLFSSRVRDRIEHLPLDDGKRLGLLSNLNKLPEGNALCHGDFHPRNMMLTDNGLVVLDWADACTGHPLADACQTFLLFLLHAPQLADPYKAFWDRQPGNDGHELSDWLTPLAFARRALNRSDEGSLASLVDMPPEWK